MPTQKNTERGKSRETSRQGGSLDKERERSEKMGRQGGQKAPGSGQQGSETHRH